MPCPFFSGLPGFSKSKKQAARTVEVGWLIDAEKAGFIWGAPKKLIKDEATAQHAKSVAYCPAVRDHEARLFEVTAPVDMHLRLQFDANSAEPALINAAGDQSSIRSSQLGQMVALVPRKEWRHPERPIVQVITPYIFLADEQVYMTQLPAFAHFHTPALPGVVIGGRLPIDVWPRQMIWAFEWFDTKADLIVKRGQPWFYVRFETADPSRAVRLIEAQMTPELREYQKGMSAVTNFVSRTFSLFSVAKERRPKTLLVAKNQ